MYSRMSWSIFCVHTWATVAVLLSLAPPVYPRCPKNVYQRANDCFSEYKVKLHIMRMSDKLCCGVDVETLRAFCHSYTSAKRCILSLRNSCPNYEHRDINAALANLEDSGHALDELCADDSIIEAYAMYQHCFRGNANRTARCFNKHMTHSKHSDIHFLSAVTVHNKETFCSDMRGLVKCVEKNYMKCGREAGKLAGVLVKPMVRQSGDCDYSQQQTTRSSHANPAYINAGGHGNRQTEVQPNNGGRGFARLNPEVIVTAVITSLWIRLLAGS